MKLLTFMGEGLTLDTVSMMIEAPERLTVTVGSGGVLSVSGDLDAHTAPDLARALDQLDEGADVVLDVGGLTFMDSSGLRVIIAMNAALSAGGGSLVLRSPSRTVRRILSVSGLEGDVVVVDAC